jgi:hypothetical protein
MPTDEAAQRRSALLVVVAPRGLVRFRARVLEACGDDFVSGLKVVRIFGKLLAVPIEECVKPLPVGEIHRVVERANELIFSLNSNMPRRSGMRMDRPFVGIDLPWIATRKVVVRNAPHGFHLFDNPFLRSFRRSGVRLSEGRLLASRSPKQHANPARGEGPNDKSAPQKRGA